MKEFKVNEEGLERFCANQDDYGRRKKTMMDLRQYTTKEFAEVINEDVEVIRELMRNNDHLGYTDKPYYHTVMAVEKSSIKDNNKEVVAKFIYTNLFNRPEHRFYDTKGYSITLR